MQRDLQRVTADGGQVLGDSDRSHFETAFGHSFADVRVHGGPVADDAARRVDAEAFTVGNHVVFRSGASSIQSSQGQRLLAHELAHVVQQRRQQATVPIDSGPSDPLEVAAEAEAALATRQASPPLGHPTSPTVRTDNFLQRRRRDASDRVDAGEDGGLGAGSDTGAIAAVPSYASAQDAGTAADAADAGKRPEWYRNGVVTDNRHSDAMGERALIGTSQARSAPPVPIHLVGRTMLQRCGGTPCPPEGCDMDRLQRLGSTADGVHLCDGEVPSALVAQAVAASGEAMDGGTSALMERRFGHDFASVRIHRGPTANESARAVSALAYTVGRDIIFADGQYAPRTDSGRRTLAHELTHVIQQERGPVDGSPIRGGLRVSDPSDRFEREAESRARRVMGADGGPGTNFDGTAPSAALSGGPGAQIQRVAPAVIAGGVAAGAALVGAGYLLWALHCLSPLEVPMSSETLRFLRRYQADMGRPIHSRVWDAFGHCWIGCAGTKKCGGTATAIAGKSREFYREYLGGGPHDSYDQDTNNQTSGRAFGTQGLDCFTACDGAIRGGTLDLSAPVATCYNGEVPPGQPPLYFYPAPCEAGGPGPGAASGTPTAAPDASTGAADAGAGALDAGTAGLVDAGLPGGVF